MDAPVVRLRALTLDDLAAVVRWSRDEGFCRANGWAVGRSEGEVRRHWARLVETPSGQFLRLGGGQNELAEIGLAFRQPANSTEPEPEAGAPAM